MHIGLICPEPAGHLNSMATLGRELARRGHRVSLLARPQIKAKADICGFELLPIGAGEDDFRALQTGLRKLSRMKGLRSVRLTGQLLRDMAAITLRDGPGQLHAAGVEAVVVDQVSLAGVALADTLRLPFVMACNALAMHHDSQVPPSVLSWRYRPGFAGRVRNRLGNTVLKLAASPIVDTVSDFRRRHGFPRLRFDDTREWGLAQIAQQPSFFDFPRAELPAHFHYTGPWNEATRDSESAPFPWEKLDGRPLVYASLGTMLKRQSVYRAILDGCAELPVQVVLSLGQQGAACDFAVPPNAIVVPFAPQLTLLDRARVLITHAGLNTVLEGLGRGVPMLCMPVTNDGPGVARRVEWLGAGEVLEPGRVTAQRVRAVVEKLLAGPYRDAALKCREQLKTNPGVLRAADIVEEAFRTGRRVEREWVGVCEGESA